MASKCDRERTVFGARVLLDSPLGITVIGILGAITFLAVFFGLPVYIGTVAIRNGYEPYLYERNMKLDPHFIGGGSLWMVEFYIFAIGVAVYIGIGCGESFLLASVVYILIGLFILLLYKTFTLWHALNVFLITNQWLPWFAHTRSDVALNGDAIMWMMIQFFAVALSILFVWLIVATIIHYLRHMKVFDERRKVKIQ